MVIVDENCINDHAGDQKSPNCYKNVKLANTNKHTRHYLNNNSNDSVDDSGYDQIMRNNKPINQVNSGWLYNVNKTSPNYYDGDQNSPNFSLERGVAYGYIPKGVLLPFHNSSNNSDTSAALDNTSHLDLYYKLQNSVLPNVLGARQRIKTGLAVDQWSHLLANYWDIQLLDFIKYGFPMEVNPLNFAPNQGVYNHPSANEFPNDVCKYLKTEIEHGAILGPFRTPPHQRATLLTHDDTRKTELCQSQSYSRSIMASQWQFCEF